MTHDFSHGCAWIDGDYLPIAEARIPITDTGFTRSDCTYDVVSVWDGRFFRLQDHFERFALSCTRGRFTPPLQTDEMQAVITECVVRAQLRHAYVELIVTRGVPPANERDPRKFINRFYAFAIPYVWILPPAQKADGVRLHVAKQTPRISPASIDPRMKNFQWGDFTQALFEAYSNDANNVVLSDGQGLLTEGPGFNLFVVADNAIRTPRSGVLEGITRHTVIELCQRAGIAIEMSDISEAELLAADEAFLTSTAGGVMAVSSVNGKRLSGGALGPLTEHIERAYWAAHSDPKWVTEIDYCRHSEDPQNATS